MSGQERDLEERKREAACLQVVDTAMAAPFSRSRRSARECPPLVFGPARPLGLSEVVVT